MSHIDLRDWLEAVEKHGELEHIAGANWDLEMGSIAELVPCPHKGYQVIWAMVTRARLDRSIHIIPNCHTNNVHPAIPPAEKMAGDKQKPLTAARVVIDACRDLSWKEDWYPIARISPELRTKIREKWKSILSKLI